MSGEILYLDSSALVKLVVTEEETEALMALLQEWPHRATGELAALDVERAAHRATGSSSVHSRAQDVLAATPLVRLDRDILDRAASMNSPGLRSLAAVHLASALALGDDLGAIVTYDERLAQAASSAGCRLLQPGI